MMGCALQKGASMATSGRVKVSVYATDPVSATGVAGELRQRPEVLVLEESRFADAQVAVVVADEVDAQTVRTVRAVQRDSCHRIVMVVARLDDSSLLAAVEAGACGILRRSEAVADRIVEAVLTAAKGDGSVPPDLLGRLLDQMSRLQRQVLAPRGLSLTGFSDRELDVLKLLSEGWDTAEIAGKLAYSERTVKNVIHDITTRLQLRNRSHAVAYAVRQGLI
jgi:DNA-binding NarL/FixJ family response regulator